MDNPTWEIEELNIPCCQHPVDVSYGPDYEAECGEIAYYKVVWSYRLPNSEESSISTMLLCEKHMLEVEEHETRLDRESEEHKDDGDA